MNKHYRDTVREMREIDQQLRTSISTGAVNELKKYLVYVVDYVNGQRLRALIDTYGYPTIDDIGESGMDDFWLLIQHQDYDLDLQKSCLEHCDFSRQNKAYLTDRVLLSEGKKQLYGTQFIRDDTGKLVPRPIEDEDMVDVRRKEVDLEPFDEYKEKMLTRDRERQKMEKNGSTEG